MKRKEFKKRIAIYGLIGWPVAHTFSPPMYNAAFKALNIRAIYLPLAVEKKEFKATLKNLAVLGFKGVNVTIPYKEDVIPYLSKIDPSASLVGAVNTIIVKGNKLIGYNTDGVGFVTSLRKEARFNPKNKKAFMLGAGGAARAVAVALGKAGLRDLYVTDLVKNRAQKLVLHINRHFKKTKAVFVPTLRNKKAQEKLKEANLVVNATGIGLHKRDPALIKPEWVHKEQLACDLIYNPPLTKFLKVYKKKGARVLNGEGMLFYQGLEAFRLFTARPAPVSVMKRALKKQIKN